MRFELHIHCDDVDILRNEKRNYHGEISIPETKAKLNVFGLTHDKSQAMGSEYISNCFIEISEDETEKVVDWLYSKIKNKAKRISIGDIRGKYDSC